MREENRIVGLDLAKLLAALLVVYYHLVFPFPPDVSSPGFRWTTIPYMLFSFVSICVPLFFASSGALLLNREASLSKTLRRCAHLLFLLVFWAVFSLALIMAMRGQWFGVKEFVFILRDLRVGFIQHLWYMPSFLILMLLSPVFQTLKKHNPKVLYYFTGVLFLFTFGDKLLNDMEYVVRWLLGKWGYYDSRSFFGYLNFFKYHYWYMFVYFVAGGLLLERAEDLKKYRKWVIAAIPLCIVISGTIAVARSQVSGSEFDPVFYNYPSMFTLILAAAVFLLLLWSRPGQWLRRFAQAVSQVSLGIYLIHWLLIEVVKSYFGFLMGNHAVAPFLTLLIFLLSFLISLGLSKVPVLKRLIRAS